MGNKLGRQVVDEKYTRPQGLYQIKDVDYKKLRKLILESKLAPCYPGDDDSDSTLLEECPICFLCYPTLNRSRCCMKSICTECFLQMKNPSLATPTLCPFCKMSNYAVEYKGVKSKEERGQEQIEEQKVIEAKIRMRQQELQEEKEKQYKKEEVSYSGRICEMENNVRSTPGGLEQREEIIRDASTTHTQSQNTRQNRDNDFDLDLEDLMVMEAIWLSIQENGLPEQYKTSDHHIPPVTVPVTERSPSSPSGGLACAIAALAEHQQLSGESSTSRSPFDMLPSSSRSSQRLKSSSLHPSENYSSRAMGNARMFTGDHEVNHLSDVSEIGTSYINSDDWDGDAVVHPPPPPPPLQYGRQNNHKRFDNIRKKYSKISKNLHDTLAKERTLNLLPPLTAGTSGVRSDGGEDGDEHHVPPPPPPLQYGSDGSFQSPISSSVIPDSFEEQMILAMAVSLAEARTTTNAPGVAFQQN